MMDSERFRSWQLVRLRGWPPHLHGSAWRVAAHIYRERALNLMDAVGMLQRDIRMLQDELEQLQDNERILLAEIAHLRLVKLAARAHLAEWESGDTFAHDTRKALKQALEGEG